VRGAGLAILGQSLAGAGSASTLLASNPGSPCAPAPPFARAPAAVPIERHGPGLRTVFEYQSPT